MVQSRSPAPTITLHTLPPSRAIPTLADEVRAGFAKRPRHLSPKHLYDERGSQLFERICDLPEYDLARTEMALLNEYARPIVEALQPASVIDLGAGTARKTETLLGACDAAGVTPVFTPLDVCQSVLRQAGERLAERFPWLTVQAIVGDHAAGLRYLPERPQPALFTFLGSSLGNFERDAARSLLTDIAARMGRQDRLLLGLDLVKSQTTMEAAYNDSQGITAEFNANVLYVLNRELRGNFDVECFQHSAPYIHERQRIESYLVARCHQRVYFNILREAYSFHEGDAIFTEISRKFTNDTIDSELAGAGLRRERTWEDDGGGFALHLARKSHEGSGEAGFEGRRG